MQVKTEAPGVAVIGMGCHYPGANNLKELWENILAKRRQFRRFPDNRLPISEYYDPDKKASDKTYGNRTAVIDAFEFDWAKRRIPKTAFDSADIVHWLALEVALQALENAGYSRENVPTQGTGVILGNTLTGEQSRSQYMRLRWPFVRKALRAAANAKGMSVQNREVLVETMEKYYKSVFAPITEDTLAGNLANTVAGRICNFFNFDGGGYVVDGACSSSLISVATAYSHLANHDLDIALAGGVDISLDTFELVGFAKTSALSADDMNVYDRRASGFIPGEGCGFVVLKRLEDARSAGDYVYAVIRGWGISSDGKGGITAPSKFGQSKALCRAYDKAYYSIHDLDFIEGHGTGTPVGDRTELEGIALAIAQDGELPARSIGITSFKSLVGHTKAAAGIGGFIKAVIAVNQRVIPPTAGCKEPNPVFDTTVKSVYPVIYGEVRQPTDVLRAGVSAMGFGGINSHITLESGDLPALHLKPSIVEQALLVSYQDTELFVLSAKSIPILIERTQSVREMAQGISVAETVDLAVRLTHELESSQHIRAALIADSPMTLVERLEQLEQMLIEAPPSPGEISVSPHKDIWIGNDFKQCRVGFLFPGQGSQKLNMARTLIERYIWAKQFLNQADSWLQKIGFEPIGKYIYRPLECAVDEQEIQEWSKQLTRADIASPAMCFVSLLWQKYLENVGIKPIAVGGHSLGELAAFCTAGAYDEQTLICLAAMRGKSMSASPDNAGSMASLACDRQTAEKLLVGVSGYVMISNINSPKQTVISGESLSVTEVIKRAKSENIQSRQLRVDNAFHSQMMTPAAKFLREQSQVPEYLAPTSIPLFSSVDGQQLEKGLELRQHFATQIISPVNFISLVRSMEPICDLMVEVGSGKVLAGLVEETTASQKCVCLPVESNPGHDRDINAVLGNFFVRGGDINWQAVYGSRLVRDFVRASERILIENQCEKPFVVSNEDKTSMSNFKDSNESDELINLLSRYFSSRGNFLAQVIQADLQNSSLLFNWNKNNIKNIPEQANLSKSLQKERVEPQTSAVTHPINNAISEETACFQEIIVDLVVEQTGYPREIIDLQARLLDDLNLDSIKSAEIVSQAAKKIGVQGELDPSSFANATLIEVADALKQLSKSQKQQEDTSKDIASVENKESTSWTRNFIVEYVAEEATTISSQEENWQNTHLFAVDDWKTAQVLIVSETEEADIVAAINQKLQQQGATVQTTSFAEMITNSLIKNVEFTHFIAVLPPNAKGDIYSQVGLKRAMERLHSVATPLQASQVQREYISVTYIQFGGGYFGKLHQIGNIEQGCTIGFASTLHLERPDLKVRIIDLPTQVELSTIEHVINDIAKPDAYLAVGYDEELTRRIPRPRIQDRTLYENRNITWTSKDVFLVTGGAKGITAECALALARVTGVKMALVGSSPHPQNNPMGNSSPEISRILRRFRDEELICQYYQCNVADAQAVAELVKLIQTDLGNVTGVIHGAASNKARRIENCSVEEAQAEIEPKVLGVMNLCHLLEGKSLKIFAGISSIGAVVGLPGNSWYSFSNEVLDLILRHFAQTNPQTSVLSIAYSVWAEVGMGARMGTVRNLGRMGIKAIPKNEGVNRFVELFHKYPGDTQVVITSSLGGVQTLGRGFDTWRVKRVPPPSTFKFIEKLEIIDPGIEIIARTHLSLENDSYVKDHVYKGSYLFPTVFGLEAMAQIVAYTVGQDRFSYVHIEDIRLERPIVVDPRSGVDIELRAQVLEPKYSNAPQQVFVEIRTEQTGFTVAHFSAKFVLRQEVEAQIEKVELPTEPLPIQPKRDLYSWLLFQGERFQRLEQIYTLNSTKMVFRTQRNTTQEAKESSDRANGPFLLGDPYYRDSLLQSVQPMVPQDLGLPIGINSIQMCQLDNTTAGSCIGVALGEGRKGKQYDTTVFSVDENWHIIDKLEGYHLRMIEHCPDHPTAEEIANPSDEKEQLLNKELIERSKALNVSIPEISLFDLPGMHSLSADERHERELPILSKTISKFLNNLE